MSTVRKFNKANAAITGFEIHNGFIGEETLLHIAQDNSFQQILEKFCNEKMRAYRDFYREYESKSLKYIDKKSNQEKVQSLYDQWFVKTINYFGYSDFKHDSIEFEDNGKAYVLLPEDESHSVAVFLCNDLNCPLSAFERGATLTNIEGETLFEDKVYHSWSLAEQVEKSMQKAGISEAILFLPFRVYYFRSDSQLSEQCLEINFSDLMKADQDLALALATHIISESFFRYHTEASSTDEDQDENNDSDESDEESEETTSSGDVKLTQSSNLFKEDLELARQITEELHKQVTLALEILANERLTVDTELTNDSKKKNSNEKVSHQLFENGLFVLYRVLFVLYAEAKKFLPVDNRQYASFYSIDHLLEWSSNYLKNEKKGIADPEGTYLWGALKALFTLLRRGIELNGKELVSPYNGQLFSPDQAEIYDNGPLLRDAAIARVLISLSKVGGDESGRKWNFENLGIEQLGAVYEAMLTQKPMILLENHEWVPAHGGGVGLVATSFADAMDLERIELDDSSAKTKRKTKGKKKKSNINIDDYISRHRPGHNPSKGKFVLSTMGGKRRQTASFYTPPKLAQFLVKRTLRPLVENKSVEEILKVKVIEPAVGSGGFLIASVRYMADELLRAKHRENHIDIRGKKKVEFSDLQRCKRQICEKCLYGVDINPLSIELTRTSLYLECITEGEPLPFLHHHLKSGNSLIQADFLAQSKTSWANDSDKMFPKLFDIPVDYLKVDNKLLEAWDDTQESSSNVKNSKELNDIFKEKISSLKAERKSISESEWYKYANSMQKNVNTLLEYVRKSQEDFEQIQNNPSIVDQLDERYKDKLSMIPDMDTILIESYEISVDSALEKKRKRALINEYGIKQYEQIVKNQRAYMRLKALGDLNISLWFWPLDNYEAYPSFAIYKELISWLLDVNTLSKNKNKSISKIAFKTLATALRTARKNNFFHWQIEYSHIFLSGGFQASISNPPWKVVGIKDKDVYPLYNPQFMKYSTKQKALSLQKMKSITLQPSKQWFSENFFVSNMSNFAKYSKLFSIVPEGKLDLCILFTLLSEKLTAPDGLMGLIVSRSSIFLNKGTKSLREHLFKEWGLETSVTFSNLMKIFEIDSRIEFSVVSGRKKSIYKPKFIHGIIDPNDLIQASKNLDSNSKHNPSFPPIELALNEITQFFGKDTLSIPAIRSVKQMDVIKALHKASGSVVYLNDLDGGFVNYEINQNRGPKKGLSVLAENVDKKDIPKYLSVLNEKTTDLIPVYRGRQFNLFDPFSGDYKKEFNFNQYAIRQKFKPEVSLDLPTIAWRAMSQSGNQRTLITSLLPPGTWCDNNVWTIQHATYYRSIAHLCIMGSIVSDFLIKLVVSTAVTPAILSQLPIPNYNSGALNEAVKLACSLLLNFPNKSLVNFGKSLSCNTAITDQSERIKTRAKIDALIWLHFGMNKEPLNAETLDWLIKTQFSVLEKKNPDYRDLVVGYFKKYASQKQFSKVNNEELFELKSNQQAA